MSKTPLPGYFIAVVSDSQMSNVNFKGDDKFDMPNFGVATTFNKQDENEAFDRDGLTYKDLVGKQVYWAKYAEADCFLFDNDLQKDVVIIAIDKLRGYEN